MPDHDGMFDEERMVMVESRLKDVAMSSDPPPRERGGTTSSGHLGRQRLELALVGGLRRSQRRPGRRRTISACHREMFR